MKLKRLRAENIRSYKDLDISFDSGVTVVSGVNGSGKSSLLEACFSGLFGSKTLSREFVLADMIRKGATTAAITLEFEQNGREYVIEQEFRYNPKTDRASSTKSVFKVDGRIEVDQATQTYEAVRALLNMDEEAYKNCVYIRQGEVDVLINAKPKDRQRMIDDLLQIGKLEEYRERAGSARVGVGRLQRDADGRIKDAEAEIEKIESEKPVDTLNALEEQSNRIQAGLDELNKKRDRAKTSMDELAAKISKYDELTAKKKSIDANIAEFNNKKNAAFSEIDTNTKAIQSKRGSLHQLNDTNAAYKKDLGLDDEDIEVVVAGKERGERRANDELNRIRNKRAVHEKDAALKDESLKDVGKQLTDCQKAAQKYRSSTESGQQEIEKHLGSVRELEEKRLAAVEKVESLGFTVEKLDNIDEIVDLLTAQQKKLHGRERELSTLIAELEKKIAKSKRLLAKGMCPTCGQDLKGSSIEEDTAGDEGQKVSLVDELSTVRGEQGEIESKLKRVKAAKGYGKEIADHVKKIELIRSKVEASGKLVDAYTTRIAEEETRARELGERRDELRLAVGEIKKLIDALGPEEADAKEEHTTARKRLDIAKNIRTNLLGIDRLQSAITQLEEKIRSAQEKIELWDSQITERRERLHEIGEELGAFDIKDMQSRRKQFESAHANIGREIEKSGMEKEEIVKQRGHMENEIKRLTVLENNLKLLTNKRDYLQAVYRDAEKLEDMYMRIRADLRARNIGALDALLNEMFSFMYTNNAYSHIKLDSDYNLTVYEKDGTPLEPKLLSGGERAIFNLVLRCAIYRLLSLGAAGTSRGAGLPPMIFDEPTVFLDRGHVHQLIKLIDMMRDIGVGQILIVSHDESLIDSADHVFVVEKDPITNTSAIAALSGGRG